MSNYIKESKYHDLAHITVKRLHCTSPKIKYSILKCRKGLSYRYIIKMIRNIKNKLLKNSMTYIRLPKLKWQIKPLFWVFKNTLRYLLQQKQMVCNC